MKKKYNLTVQQKRSVEAFFRREHDRFERRFDEWPAEIADVENVDNFDDVPINIDTGGIQQNDVPSCTPGGGQVVEEELTLLSGQYVPSQNPQYYLSVYANGVIMREITDYTFCGAGNDNICLTVGGEPVVLARYVV